MTQKSNGTMEIDDSSRKMTIAYSPTDLCKDVKPGIVYQGQVTGLLVDGHEIKFSKPQTLNCRTWPIFGKLNYDTQTMTGEPVISFELPWGEIVEIRGDSYSDVSVQPKYY
jgi:hypothetical protein